MLDNTGKPVPRRVLLGITDGADTALMAGDLTDGARVIVADASTGAPSEGRPNGMPLGFGPRGGGRK